MTAYVGSCLCKAVAFKLEGEFTGFFLCHCSRCRKETGSAHAANLFSATAAFEWTAGRASVKTFRLPGTRFAKSFCEHCGSALPTVEDGGRLLVPAGSLDSEVDVRPNAHIFMGSKATWEKNFESAATFDTFPK